MGCMKRRIDAPRTFDSMERKAKAHFYFNHSNQGPQEWSTSCVEVTVYLKRRVGNQLMNTYLPTTCLLWTIYLTHYFKIEHYDTRIMVSLTGKHQYHSERC